ncbi:MAG TPA: STAS domain-containing protein [Bryobacteraceae bacterium]|jgi:anti-sigma B factor antagonist
MQTRLHADPIDRERLIVQYLARKLDPVEAAAFEDHYLTCDDCFEEIRAAELLIGALGETGLRRIHDRDVTVLRFAGPAELTCTSLDLKALMDAAQAPGETKVLIDLSKVSRIDSSGLGMLMRCYTHAVRNAGALKLLNPTRQVMRVLSMTRIDSVVPTFEDEQAALKSF